MDVIIISNESDELLEASLRKQGLGFKYVSPEDVETVTEETVSGGIKQIKKPSQDNSWALKRSRLRRKGGNRDKA